GVPVGLIWDGSSRLEPPPGACARAPPLPASASAASHQGDNARSSRAIIGSCASAARVVDVDAETAVGVGHQRNVVGEQRAVDLGERSEEHTSELQSRENLVCRLLLEKKKKEKKTTHHN